MTTTSTTPPVTIRRASADDATTVHTLVLEIAAHEGDLAHVQTTPSTWATMLERNDVIVLLAERDGHALGYTSAVRRLHLWSGGDIIAVDDVYVRPGERSAGIGRRLLATIAAYADPEGLLVTWGLEPQNLRARQFYAELGAFMRKKLIAGWAPSAYRPVIAATELVSA